MQVPFDYTWVIILPDISLNNFLSCNSAKKT